MNTNLVEELNTRKIKNFDEARMVIQARGHSLTTANQIVTGAIHDSAGSKHLQEATDDLRAGMKTFFRKRIQSTKLPPFGDSSALELLAAIGVAINNEMSKV